MLEHTLPFVVGFTTIVIWVSWGMVDDLLAPDPSLTRADVEEMGSIQVARFKLANYSPLAILRTAVAVGLGLHIVWWSIHLSMDAI